MARDERIDCRDRISRNPAGMVGKSVIRGTRLAVERILGHLAHNPGLNELFAAYRELTLDDVKAALGYAKAD